MKINVQTITPALAEKWLAQGGKNRKIMKNVVAVYADDMRSGQWKLTGEAIKFNGDGSLLDGQNRLRACVVAGVPFDSVVVSGLESEAQALMDTGVKRSLYHTLAIHNVQNASTCAAITTAIYRAKNIEGDERYKRRISIARLLPLFDKHSARIRKAASVLCSGTRRNVPLASGILGFIAAYGGDAGVAFVEVMKTGEATFKGDPALALRERLLHIKSKKMRVSAETKFWTTIAVFNAFRAKVPLDRIDWQHEPITMDGVQYKSI